jgi:hypothetical protein
VAAPQILPRDFLKSALVVLKKRVSLGLFDEFPANGPILDGF